MSSASDFLNGRFGSKGWPVFRLGLAATYRPGERAIEYALDQGVNYLFGFPIDTQLTRVIRSMNADRREKVLIATGGANWLLGHVPLRRSLESALRRLGADYIDVFHYLGVLKREHVGPGLLEELARLREDGLVRAVGVSCHNRKLAGEFAAAGTVDALMIRYNAAHTEAETEVFPHITAHDTAVAGFTATRWTRLLARPKGWPEREPVATAGQCYRFVLSNPTINVALTAPCNESELAENLAEVRRGPLPEDEMAFLRRFGACVRDRAGWFMGG